MSEPKRSSTRGQPEPEELAALRQRLQRLGLVRASDYVPAPASRKTGDIDELTEGETLTTPLGVCFCISRRFPAGHRHGGERLSDWLALDSVTLAGLANDPRIESVPASRLVFLDTETTGLGGVGAFAFEVGLGTFEPDGSFLVRQLFLRDPADEAAMLHLISEWIGPGAALATYNGRGFDVPLLASRYILNRLPGRVQISGLPNLDLLMPARKLWKRRLGSCSLGSLEQTALGMQRTGQDVPGFLIPALYNQYLHSRDAGEMLRVLYHNEIDVLTMVSLGLRLARAFSGAEADLPLEDRLSLAAWYASLGQEDHSEAHYRLAADLAPEADTRREALWGLSMLLKRQGRREEAAPLWAFIADLKLDLRGHEELAKYHEWHSGDLHTALDWSQQAIDLASGWQQGYLRAEALRLFGHRRARLLRKINRQDGAGDEADEEEQDG